MEAVGGEADDDVARFDAAAVDHFLAIHHADDGSREVVFAGLVHAGHLRGLAADEGASAGLAGFGKAGEQLFKHGGFQFFRADVVEKEQRARAEHGDVVDAMVHQVLAHGVMASGGEGDLQFRAHAVHAGDEHRIAHPFEIRAEEAAEAADLAEHFRPVRDLHHVVDAALDGVAEIDVHARLRVGFFGGGGGFFRGVGLGCHSKNEEGLSADYADFR